MAVASRLPGRAGMKRRAVIWILSIAVMLIVLTRFASLSELAGVLGQARWGWVSLGVLLHLVYLYGFTLLYKVGFDTVGVESNVRAFLPVYLASNVANALAPSGGAAATALFVTEARSRGQSGARTALAVVMVTVADLLSLVPFLIAGIVLLRVRGLLRSYELVGAGVFLFFVVALASVLWVARRAPRTLERLLGLIERIANGLAKRFHREWRLSDDWAATTAGQAAEAAGAIHAHRARMVLATALALGLQLLNVAMLLFLFYAFDQPVALDVLVAGYGLGIVFYVVSFVPQGIAFVEGMMALVFTSFGYPGGKVAAIVLAFRGLNYWLPLVIGLPFVRRLAPRGSGADKSSPRGEPQVTRSRRLRVPASDRTAS